MKILVANLGSTSFKYQLIDMDGERRWPAARSSGSAPPRAAAWSRSASGGGEALRVAGPRRGGGICLAQLTDPESGCIRDAGRSVGDRVQGGAWGARGRRAARDAEVLDAMQEAADIAPAHNPAYIAADAAAEREAARRSRWWRPSRPISTAPSPTATAITPCPSSGPRRGSCGDGVTTGRATATSPPAPRNSWAAATCGSSPATWADRAPSARSATARAWPTASASSARRACRTTTAWAISTPSPCRWS